MENLPWLPTLSPGGQPLAVWPRSLPHSLAGFAASLFSVAPPLGCFPACVLRRWRSWPGSPFSFPHATWQTEDTGGARLGPGVQTLSSHGSSRDLEGRGSCSLDPFFLLPPHHPRMEPGIGVLGKHRNRCSQATVPRSLHQHPRLVWRFNTGG